jgi:molecular chaperone GrpE
MKERAEPTENIERGEQAAEAADASEEGLEGAGSEGHEPQDPMSALEARCADFESRWLRAQADYHNTKRRAQQELESALLETMQPLLDELLLVKDYLDMALIQAPQGQEAKALAAGVDLTRAKLVQALELVDVRTVPTTGIFDPALHEAAEARPSEDGEPGTILETLRTGYTWQGRILRPARVIVAADPDS